MFPRIKILRKENKLTQDDMAKILKISKSSYARYESGKRGVPVKIIVGLAEYYNVSMDYLFGRTDIMQGY